MKHDQTGRESPVPLCKHVAEVIDAYFENLDGHKVSDLYRLVISEVERPLLQRVLHHAGGNQTRAAEILGINRTTLRKKLRQHGID
jgi:Fis family transcriptional regulator, factor for inversion stimulation protein